MKDEAVITRRIDYLTSELGRVKDIELHKMHMIERDTLVWVLNRDYVKP